ncbi:cytochrome c-type biogenesis protein, partial [Vibrio parahaemolyticus]|uniref:cytochrome c-type biogenesis protein n=1 Tax=Vibrio parahaemolyticus TaxID=670 RepID=UPI00146A1E5A
TAAPAHHLRHNAHALTKEPTSNDEIVDYPIARYANPVTYNPPFTVATAILWLGPLAVVLGGFGLIVLRSRKSKVKAKASSDEQWDEQKEARLKALLEEENNGDKK